MRVLVLVTLLSIGLITPLFDANAQEKISQLEYDLLKVRLTEQLKDEQYEEMLDSIAALKSSGYEYSHSLIYFQGFAYLNLERLVDADNAFRTYIEIAGTEGKHYRKALKKIIEIEKKVEQASEQNEESQAVATPATETWEITTDGESTYYDITQSKNGDIIATGSHSDEECKKSTSWRTTRMTLSGDIVADQIHCNPQGANQSEPVYNKTEDKITWRTHKRKNKELRTERTLDDDIVVAIYQDDDKEPYSLILELDSTGKIIWEHPDSRFDLYKKYAGKFDDHPGAKFHDDAATDDGGYIVVGSYLTKEHARQGWIFKVNNSGQVLWSETHGGKGFDRFTSISKLQDGSGYLVIGHKAGKGWIVKLDNNGRL